MSNRESDRVSRWWNEGIAWIALALAWLITVGMLMRLLDINETWPAILALVIASVLTFVGVYKL